MIPMLDAAGFRAKLLTPEWATLWANVPVGKVPFYYMGRGGVVDPSLALSQYNRRIAAHRLFKSKGGRIVEPRTANLRSGEA